MHLPPIGKVFSLSLLTVTAVIARPLQNSKGAELSESKRVNPPTDGEGALEERDRIAFPAIDFSSPEFFPKAQEHKGFLSFFRRKRAIGCNSSGECSIV
ncbi:hypothetical protein BDP27DRAFT_1433328 [Rhodocollybia butyracea]|uniref:Uncharacterized protein n=1 Tax=Rhodocollybia butyracea TaxID=206335 RepID=A0A9P5P6I4_9AGAR|nr:hypothetical protein BDP27DRAFT_1433328 [Rhodocollybia butyracea]